MTNTWNIDSAHSAIAFSIRHMVFSKVRGRFTAYTGAIELVDDDLAKSRVDVTIDAASIDTGTAQRDAHLRSADFFDAETFPQLRFRSKTVTPHGDGLRVTGELTIRDVTREVTLDVEQSGRALGPDGQERIGFVAKTSIDRKAFGLTWNQLREAGGVLVGERVDIELDVQAIKAQAATAAA